MSDAIWIAIITSGVLSTIVSQLFAWLRDRKKKPTAIDNALQWLMHDKLEFLMTKAIVKGETSMHERSFIRNGYKFYNALGGNGDITDLLHDFDELPVKY